MKESACDLIIDARWIIPISPPNDWLEHASIAIHEGLIVKVGPQELIHHEFRGKKIISLDNHILLPGLVNAHGHAAMTLFRGFSEDMALENWLSTKIWPLETKWVDADFVQTGSELAIAEMLHSGITCFADMYFFPEIVARTAKNIGIRSQIAFPIMSSQNRWSKSTDECFHKGLALHDEYRSDDAVNIVLGPHSAYSVSEKDLQKVLMFSEELSADVHIHLHETNNEITEAHRKQGGSWIEFLNRVGLLSPRLQAVHAVHLQPDEIQILVENQVKIIHCPGSNLKLASGIAPIRELLSEGLAIGLGTDSAASNNSLDILMEARLAALIAKHLHQNADAISASQVLEMATLGGARTLGLDHLIGSLEPGKSADMIAINVEEAKYQPIYDPIAQLIYTNSSASASDSWVRGKHLLKSGKLVTIDKQQVLEKTKDWQRRIAIER
tara:strand:+ start:302 stop:1627 length:1326 start_codon:yes stop_codon:yes gene_type:complete